MVSSIIAGKTAVYILDNQNREKVLHEVSKSLKEGNICILPTDTLYGIVALDPFKEAVERIYLIKNRPASKPLIRLIGSMNNLKSYTNQEIPPSLRKYWPGPLTLIFKGIQGEKVSLRFPDDPFLNDLFPLIDYGVLVAPSANVSGDEDIFDNERLIDTFSGKVHSIVCIKAGLKKRKPSTILDISEPVWKIAREGALEIDLNLI